ncbi:MAG: hypothetical protein J5441_07015 [Clostridia bacterium]|nr:hypothetical protein [Clostridia bacterium]
MNTTVTAANMQVKAVADQGILINVEDTADSQYWDSNATTNQTTGILLHATSTADTTTWYVAHSKITSDAAKAGAGAPSSNLTTEGYKTLGTDPYSTATSTVAAAAASHQAKQDITYVDTGATGYTNGEGYYVKYTYFLKSSAEAITTSLAQGEQNLNITVKATGPDTATSANLDKALRVAVKIAGRVYFFAPVVGADGTYYVNAGSNPTTPVVAASASAGATSATNVLTIPAVTADGLEADVFVYFEGEDTNLMTDNALSTLDNLIVSVEFSLVKNASAISTAPGVALA